MKFQPIFNLWAIALFSVLFVTACDNTDDPEPDTTIPEISVAQPTEGREYQPGETIELIATITDETEVSEVDVEIHNAFDGHTHSDKTAPWSWRQVFTANSASFNLAETVVIPDSALTGPYHVIFKALDASGNAAQLMEVNFEITGNSQPTVNSVTVNGNAVLSEIHEHFDEGTDTVDYAIKFAAEDADGLEHIKLKLEHHAHDHDHGGHNHDKTNDGDHGHGEAYWEKEIMGNSQTLVEVEETIEFRKADMEDGDYELRIMVEDLLGNVKVHEVKFHVGDH